MGSTLFQLLIAGVCIGFLYSLLGASYALFYRSKRSINFAQGDIAMLGAYIAFWPVLGAGHLTVWTVLVSLVVLTLAAGAIEVVFFRPLYARGPLYVIVSSIGLVFVVQTAILLIWGPQTVLPKPLWPGSIHVFGLVLSHQLLLLVIVSGSLAMLLQLAFRGRIGIAMRAAAENPAVARLSGVDDRTMATLSFMVAAALSGIAGILVAPVSGMSPSAGAALGLAALVGAIIGGLGNLYGAVVGGVFIGLVNSFAVYYVGAVYADVITYSLLVIALVLRPGGLLREEGMVSR